MKWDMNEDVIKTKEETKELPGRYVARMEKNAQGMFVDEIIEHHDGTKTLCVFPYTPARAAKKNFREMTMDEINKYFNRISGLTSKKIPADVLERQVIELKKKLEEIEKKEKK